MKNTMRKHNFVSDMINVCSRIVDPATAKRGVRSLCRYFGGQLIYVPLNKADGESAKRVRGVLADEVGDADAEKVLERLMTFYGGMQIYIPLEKTGFKRDIALEIYEKYKGGGEGMSKLCREYNMTYTQVYRLWHDAAAIKREEREAKNSLFD